MRLKDDRDFPINEKQYIDINSKIIYLASRYGFKLFKNHLKKNDLMFPIEVLFNYSKEQLDILNLLAEKYYVFNPYEKEYMGEYMIVTFENMHDYSFNYLKFLIEYAQEVFYDNNPKILN